jgi:steroid delta-isomerase-like uncharacterized protein
MSSKTQPTPEELSRRDMAMWNEADLDRIDDIYAADCTYHDSFGEAYDREALHEYVSGVLAAFPDLHVEEDETIADENTVTSRYTLSGTLEGAWRGFEPTGERFEVGGVICYHVDDGRIVEALNTTTSMAIARQVGLLG